MAEATANFLDYTVNAKAIGRDTRNERGRGKEAKEAEAEGWGGEGGKTLKKIQRSNKQLGDIWSQVNITGLIAHLKSQIPSGRM